MHLYKDIVVFSRPDRRQAKLDDLLSQSRPDAADVLRYAVSRAHCCSHALTDAAAVRHADSSTHSRSNDALPHDFSAH